MANAHENLSPEERLLRVIQSGDDLEASEVTTAAGATTGPAATEPSVTEPIPKSAPQQKQKLKLADKEDDVSAADSLDSIYEADAEVDESLFPFDVPTPFHVNEAPVRKEEKRPPAPASAVVSTVGLPQKKGTAERPGALVIINRCLALAIMVVLAFTAFEVFSRAGVPPVAVAPVPPRMEKRIERLETPDQESLVAKYLSRDIFRIPAQVGRDDVPEENAGKVYVQRNLKLIGISPYGEGELEAIVVDVYSVEPGSKGKMLFLREGQGLPLADESLKDVKAVLTSVGPDFAVFSVNGEDVRIEAGK